MYKGKEILAKVMSAAFILFCPLSWLHGQSIDALGSYSPYSMFGVGKIAAEGTAYNYSMGGVGVGMRDNRVINFINPAAITARDTLSFMFDFGVNEKNSYFNDDITKSAYNVFNMQNVALHFLFTSPRPS